MSEQGTPEPSGLVFQEISTEGRSRKYKFRSLRGLSFVVLALGLAHCWTASMLGIALVHQWQLLLQMSQHVFLSREAMLAAGRSNDRMVRSLADVSVIAQLLTNIAAATWIYRAACNIRALGARRLKNTPGWAVGWYFVPFAALFKPFGAMVEIWNASLSPEGWRTRPVPGLLRWWWGLWIGLALVGYVGLILSNAGKTMELLIFRTQAQIAGQVWITITNVVFLVIVWRITRMQAVARRAATETADVFS